MSKKNSGKKVILVGQLFENMDDAFQEDNKKRGPTKDEMGKFLLSIPKDLRRKIKFESEEQGFKNASSYICQILQNRHPHSSNED